MSYDSIYQKRLNRYGLNYQERVMTQRREVFKRRIEKSVYRIDFDYKDRSYEGTFERYKQDETQTLRYLFTSYDLYIENGTILWLPDPIGILGDLIDENETYIETNELLGPQHDHPGLRPWMVYYLEDTGAKGYNRYIMLRMTHYLQWKDRDRIDRQSYAYMYGQEDNMLKDELKSRSRMDPLYTEALKMSFFVMPANEHLRKDDYFIIDKTINNKKIDEFYRVTGYDIQSSDGIEFVTVDPMYEYSKDFHDDYRYKRTIDGEEETDEQFEQRKQKEKEEIFDSYYWLDGGTTEIRGDK